jgi:hypothetical protein
LNLIRAKHRSSVLTSGSSAKVYVLEEDQWTRMARLI